MRVNAYQFWREMDAWKVEKLNRLPRVWRDAVAKKHGILAKKSLREANEFLVKLIEPLEGYIDIGASDDDLQALAKECAAKCSAYFADHLLRNSGYEFQCWDLCLALANLYAVRYPFEHDMNQQKARLVDHTFWLRNLRNSHAKAREAAARDAGIVHKKHDVYVSDDTVERRKQQLRRNRELMGAVEMVSEDGEIMKLSEIAAAGMSNHENRRAELMTRIAGFEALSVKYNHKAIFVTLTTPSRMHKMLSSGKENPKYDGTKPDEAQKYLVQTWARTRALLAKHDVKCYGLRVAEPHHDGTPHWHMILFYDGKPSTKNKLKWHITGKFIEADREELHRDISPRVKFVDINPAKGTACGYVAKYVAKNIGGIEGESSDEGGGSSESVAERVEAWASTWRIRQFQQIGGHSVSVWRELRRVDACQLEGKGVRFVRLWDSVQKTKERNASFAAFIECMGGLETPPRESLYRVDYDALEVDGKYGKTWILKPLGVGERFGFEVVATSRKVWTRM